jgi:hypothetical protein
MPVQSGGTIPGVSPPIRKLSLGPNGRSLPLCPKLQKCSKRHPLHPDKPIDEKNLCNPPYR